MELTTIEKQLLRGKFRSMQISAAKFFQRVYPELDFHEANKRAAKLVDDNWPRLKGNQAVLGEIIHEFLDPPVERTVLTWKSEDFIKIPWDVTEITLDGVDYRLNTAKNRLIPSKIPV